MFDIGWTEMLMVAVVAIIVVGPKDLPGMLRTFGRTVKKVRSMAGDFQQQFNEALEEAELDGVKDTIADVRKLDPTKNLKDKLNPLKDEVESVKKSVKESTDFDPDTLLDEKKAPDAAEAVKADTDTTVEQQKNTDAQAAKPAPDSGKNAVPGFGGAKAEATSASKAKTAAVKKSAAKAKKTGAKAKKAPAKPKAARKASA